MSGRVSWGQDAADGVLTAVEALWVRIKAWRSRKERVAMYEGSYPPGEITAANEEPQGWYRGCFMDKDQPVLTLARLLGRQIAREEFERGLTAINDNARREIGEG